MISHGMVCSSADLTACSSHSSFWLRSGITIEHSNADRAGFTLVIGYYAVEIGDSHLPYQLFFYKSNFMVADNVRRLERTMRQARAAGYNGVVLDD